MTEIDITLLVEGTFPYVTGGVSSWIYQILCSFPQYRFAIIFLGSVPEDYGEPKYKLTDNIVHLEKHYLFSSEDRIMDRPKNGFSQALFDDITTVHHQFKNLKSSPVGTILSELTRELFSKTSMSEEQFLYSQAAWEYLTQQYSEQAPDISFIDYFWSVRNMHAPIWKLIQVAEQAPPSKILHSASTGYAGLLGAFIQSLRQCPFVLTEHGIYTKERRIDLPQTEFSAYTNPELVGGVKTTRYLSQLWIRFFERLAEITYAASNPIISLFDAYQQRQIKDGAPAERTQVIANGIALSTFRAPPNKKLNTENPIFCFLGRVIQIKDVKNFIRASANIIHHIPNATAWVVGSSEESEDYANECHSLIEMLHLKDKVLFLGKQVTQEILPKVDLLLLSSISEGLPFVILEGFACGVPAITTDVGACRELIYGKTEEDKNLGKAGEVVGIANSIELANAAVTLLRDPQEWQRASEAGMQRVNRFYDLRAIMNAYGEIYEKAMHTWQG